MHIPPPLSAAFIWIRPFLWASIRVFIACLSSSVKLSLGMFFLIEPIMSDLTALRQDWRSGGVFVFGRLVLVVLKILGGLGSVVVAGFGFS